VRSTFVLPQSLSPTITVRSFASIATSKIDRNFLIIENKPKVALENFTVEGRSYFELGLPLEYGF
jgi:hypothetical protein